MTDLQMLRNSFCKFGLVTTRRPEDLVPLFDPKVHLFENSLLKMLAAASVVNRKYLYSFYMFIKWTLPL